MAALDSSPLTLSILVPCYNEEATIGLMLDTLEQLAAELAPEGIAMEIVAVDDASRDRTHAILTERAAQPSAVQLRVVRHEVNRGKGRAIRTARDHATGEIMVIQDADLEYDPWDIPVLIAPILEGRADAVIGSRFIGAGAHRVLYFWHRMANGMLTFLSNMLTDLNLTDMEVGYKAFTREAFRTMYLTTERFGIEPEIVARLSQMRARVYEVPINYYGRTYEEGKKITWRDGVAALKHITHAAITGGKQPRLAPSPHAPAVPFGPPRRPAQGWFAARAVGRSVVDG
ncbi:MAG TPA: glycosyltransferase family 2 protein [Gemmatimonadaceae bacterium]|nr:glycosyltransferase family 2 protein [Gemmatimonadaceae bacterium]